MRHRKSGRKLGRNQTERKAMFRNMVTSLVIHERIHTTEAKAKELRRFAERVVSIAKRAPSTDGLSGEALAEAKAKRVHAIRRARRLLQDDSDALSKLFEEFATRYADRPGGYTRVIKAGFRNGDNAPMAYIEFVEAEMPKREAKKAAPATKEAPVAAAADDAAATEADEAAGEE